jgi:hypothetical protein
MTRRWLNFDELYGIAFKVVAFEGNPYVDGFSIVTPQNGASWTEWPEMVKYKRLVEERLNNPDFLADYKYKQIIESAIEAGVMR